MLADGTLCSSLLQDWPAGLRRVTHCRRERILREFSQVWLWRSTAATAATSASHILCPPSEQSKVTGKKGEGRKELGLQPRAGTLWRSHLWVPTPPLLLSQIFYLLARTQCKELWEMSRRAARWRQSLASTGSTQGQKETTSSEITLGYCLTAHR